ncbi:Protein of unknown function [Marivirga sericea]|uniref:DUF1700 domain-containing protein n=1 Tax=Marivirga sericea TaxID=1028 RepID=A0A1X7K4X0_9BACT|nr:DUF1700 domain-containing protein [Marivirga sericea]SMG35984.1 Protein of unknown function [Marivirga sericea]
MMKEIEFQDKTCQKLYDNYILRIKRQTSTLSKEDRFDIMMEFNSHIYEALQEGENKTKIEKLVEILDKLGNPEDVLKSMVADKKLIQATRTFNPIHVFKAISLNIASGISFVIFGIMYLLLLAFGFLIVQKIFHPDEVGLFFKKGEFFLLGILPDRSHHHYSEVLGNWFIPVMLISAILLYVLLTLLLRLKRKLK